MNDNDPFWNDLFEEVHHDMKLAMNCELLLLQDKIALSLGIPGRWYYQIKCERPDAITGEMGTGYGGKVYLSPHASRTELVQIVMGLYKGYWEHEAREGFWYAGEQVFGPHIDVLAHHKIAGDTEYRDV